MAISTAGVYRERLGDRELALKLTNAEIDRFEELHDLGVFEFWDQLNGRGKGPQARHVRDLVALGLAGAGMPDRQADKVLDDLDPSHSFTLRAVAQRLLGVTFLPELLLAGTDEAKKNDGGASPDETSPPPDTAPDSVSPTSAA